MICGMAKSNERTRKSGTNRAECAFDFGVEELRNSVWELLCHLHATRNVQPGSHCTEALIGR